MSGAARRGVDDGVDGAPVAGTDGVEAGSVEAPSYPRLERYLASLPDGLAAHPSCTAKASVHRTVADYHGGALPGLPTPLQQLLSSPPAASSWVPQVHTLALIVAMVESAPPEQGGEGVWIRKAARALFDTPMYRILMRAASPQLLFKGAHLRWTAFFRGSRLEGQVFPDRRARVVLASPPGLFNEDLAGIFAHVLNAALSCTEDDAVAETGARVELASWSAAQVIYEGRW